MTYNELRDALKTLRDAGKTDIKLSGKGITKDVLQAEYDRVTRTIKTTHTFSDMLPSRKSRKPAKGFSIVKVVRDEFEGMREGWKVWETISMMSGLLDELEEMAKCVIAI
jgi:hypothetical protein